jgi:dipeptidyl aminopeptidase/acylaminoacyl peptidase
MIHMLLAAAAQLLSPASSPLNDYNLSTDHAERRMVFARSEADFARARIYVADRRGRGWTDPRPIEFSDARYSDSDPWLTPDGRTLYFVSDRPTASRPDKKDLDIWRSRLVGGRWSAPEHLGDAVNSRGPELGPEVRGSVLTFGSVRKGGRGGLDIYAAPIGDGLPGPAALLDGPFNSAESDSDLTFSADGKRAAFWRGSGGAGRIYVSRKLEAGWSEPEILPDSVNIGPFNFTPSFSPDGRTLTFASTKRRESQPEGMADVYKAPLP